jgi:hypothetical protein
MNAAKILYMNSGKRPDTKSESSRYIEGRMNGWIDGWWMDEWDDGWVDGWMGGIVYG